MFPQTESPSTEEPIETKAPAAEPPATQEPVPTEIPPTEPPPTEPPEIVCAKLLTPENGVYVPAVGKVTFAWEPVDGAENYILRFTLPTGNIVEFETDEITKERYMEAFSMSGEFKWDVIAFDLNGSEICISESSLFTKPASGKSKGSGDGENGGAGGGSDQSPPPDIPDG